ncbi:MAG: hypothetical protein CMJ24_11680 [Phycisphaerae bacterium]|nr:hypothetical protein [Phycisphaerae bacterium]|tara:strand:- start:4274 stop:4513 length:240 start_codon:yes stop_codon:yes gene_type:complete
MQLIAWIPFAGPLNSMQSIWYVLLVPLTFGIAVAYKAMRVSSLENYWRQVLLMTTQVTVGIVALGILLILFVKYLVPIL